MRFASPGRRLVLLFSTSWPSFTTPSVVSRDHHPSFCQLSLTRSIIFLMRLQPFLTFATRSPSPELLIKTAFKSTLRALTRYPTCSPNDNLFRFTTVFNSDFSPIVLFDKYMTYTLFRVQTRLCYCGTEKLSAKIFVSPTRKDGRLVGREEVVSLYF